MYSERLGREARTMAMPKIDADPRTNSEIKPDPETSFAEITTS